MICILAALFFSVVSAGIDLELNTRYPFPLNETQLNCSLTFTEDQVSLMKEYLTFNVVADYMYMPTFVLTIVSCRLTP